MRVKLQLRPLVTLVQVTPLHVWQVGQLRVHVPEQPSLAPPHLPVQFGVQPQTLGTLGVAPPQVRGGVQVPQLIGVPQLLAIWPQLLGPHGSTGVQHAPLPFWQTSPAWQQVGDDPLVRHVARAAGH